jgi:hypothetical protein
MSYIDTFDNEFVGYFGGIPVYHPLEVVPASPDDPACFACGPENLVIGGGRGERPGLVVKEAGETVACFVRAWLRWQEQNWPEEYQVLRPAVAAWPDAVAPLEDCRYWRRVLEFAGWQAADYVKFSAWCASPVFQVPYDPAEHGSLEAWLAESVGEFIFLAMPELAPDALRRLGDLRHHVSEGFSRSRSCYPNLLLAPPGYPVWGRREVDNNVIWGISAWAIERRQHPRTSR